MTSPSEELPRWAVACENDNHVLAVTWRGDRVDVCCDTCGRSEVLTREWAVEEV